MSQQLKYHYRVWVLDQEGTPVQGMEEEITAGGPIEAGSRAWRRATRELLDNQPGTLQMEYVREGPIPAHEPAKCERRKETPIGSR